MTREHPSNSAVQKSAEASIIAAAAAALSLDLVRDRQATSISIGDHVHVEVDAATYDQSTVVEAYARQGTLKGAQLKKIAQDVLKLALIKQHRAPADTVAVIVFASDEAQRSISGWVREAADRFGVCLMTVEIPPEVRAAIVQAQSRQVMINAIDVADDVSLESLT